MAQIDPNKESQLLRDEFLSSLEPHLSEIAAACRFCFDEDRSPASLKDLLFLVHRLAGSAAVFNYHEISMALKKIEAVLLGFKARYEAAPEEADVSFFEQAKPRLKVLFDELRAAADRKKLVLSDALQQVSNEPSLKETRASKLVYLVEDDPIQARELATQVGYFGYTVSVFNLIDQLRTAVNEKLPAVILMDMAFPEDEEGGARIVHELRASLGKVFEVVPVIFISASDDIHTRLMAVRAGGQAYFTKPVDVGSLIDALDQLTVHEKQAPYRVLIVEDSITQAGLYSSMLKHYAVETQIISDPLKVMKAIVEFNPDLILLDMYMPECNGNELAQVIRQNETYVSIPIVFLSAETDKDKQLEAMSAGGDDFLSKPIKATHLIKAVTSRVERYRKLRALMMNDSLTGLLNHTSIKVRLTQELNRSRRQENGVLSYVMLDIDHFKNINDTYGHATGDRVLKSLARFLQQRLRRSDVIGRYGGEEFAIILPDTPLEQAYALMQELNHGFSKVHHIAGKQEFSVTFSAGVAGYPNFMEASELSDAADMALYQAKNSGRNRVMTG